MKFTEWMTELFYIGEWFITRYETCEGEEMFVVETPQQEIVFEITKVNWEKVKEAHPNEEVVKMPCGCIAHVIVPGGNERAVSPVGFSKN